MIETTTLQATLDELDRLSTEGLKALGGPKALDPARDFARQVVIEGRRTLTLEGTRAALSTNELRKLITNEDGKLIFNKRAWAGRLKEDLPADAGDGETLTLRIPHCPDIAENSRRIAEQSEHLGVTARFGELPAFVRGISDLQLPAEWPGFHSKSAADLDELAALAAHQSESLRGRQDVHSHTLHSGLNLLAELQSHTQAARTNLRFVTIGLPQAALRSDLQALYRLLGTYGGGLPLLTEQDFIALTSGTPFGNDSVRMLWQDTGGETILMVAWFKTVSRAEFYSRDLRDNLQVDNKFELRLLSPKDAAGALGVTNLERWAERKLDEFQMPDRLTMPLVRGMHPEMFEPFGGGLPVWPYHELGMSKAGRRCCSLDEFVNGRE